MIQISYPHWLYSVHVDVSGVILHQNIQSILEFAKIIIIFYFLN